MYRNKRSKQQLKDKFLEQKKEMQLLVYWWMYHLQWWGDKKMLGWLQKDIWSPQALHVFEVFVHVHFGLYLSVSPCTCQLQPSFKICLTDRQKKTVKVFWVRQRRLFFCKSITHVFLWWSCRVKEKLFWNTKSCTFP